MDSTDKPHFDVWWYWRSSGPSHHVIAAHNLMACVREVFERLSTERRTQLVGLKVRGSGRVIEYRVDGGRIVGGSRRAA